LDADALGLEPDALAKVIVDTATAAARDALDRQKSYGLKQQMRTPRETPLTRWDAPSSKPQQWRSPADRRNAG